MSYRSRDVDRLRSNLEQVDQAYGTDGGASVRKSICSRLCTVALIERNTNMLRTVLQKDLSSFDLAFHWTADDLKHDGSAPDIVKVIDESGYVSPLPPGKRWRDIHPLDLVR